MIDFKLINEIFPDSTSVVNHRILVREGKVYKTTGSAEIQAKNKVNLSLLLHALLTEIQKEERTDRELKKTLTISQYFIQKYDDCFPIPMPKISFLKKIESIISRFTNWKAGNGFNTHLEVARHIQKIALAHRNLSLDPHYQWPPADHPKSSAVTFNFDPSYTRFGDNFLSYLKGKYASITFGVPLLHKPFEYSDQLLATEKFHYLDAFRNRFDKVVLCNTALDLAPLKYNTQQSTLYVLSYWGGFNDYGDVAIHKTEIHKCLKIKPDFSFLSPTSINVALHVRTGGGCKHDTDATKKRHPTKFPPESFYLEALIKVFDSYKDQPITIHLFTDAADSESFINRVKSIFPEKAYVKFAYRQTGNTHDTNVIKDFLKMSKCKVLIRPDSSFSMASSFIGEHEFLIHPKQAKQAKKKNGEIPLELIVDDKRIKSK